MSSKLATSLVKLDLLSLSAPAQQNYSLTGGSTPYEGTVEVFRNGQWQTVCDDEWSLTTGNLVCRLLGYGPAIQVYSGAHFGEGAGNIWGRRWVCNGKESSLEECGVFAFCIDQEAAGVSCNPTVDSASVGIPAYAWFIVGFVGIPLVICILVCICCIAWSISMTCCCTNRHIRCSCETCCPWKCYCGTACKNSIKTCCKPCKICCSNLGFCLKSCCTACGRCVMASGKACCLPLILCGRCIKTSLITMGRNIKLCCHNMARCLRSCCKACCEPIVRCWTNLGKCIKAAFISCGRCLQSCMTACCTPCVLCCTAMGNCTKFMCAALGSCFKACGRGLATCCYYAWISLCCPCIVFCSDKETLHQYKRDITGVCGEAVDEEAGVGGGAFDNVATVGDGAVDNVATDDHVGCEGCILSMQSSVQACCFIPYTEDEDQRPN